MGADKIRYFVYSKGRWKWQPTNAMRVHGFNTVKMGRGGPALDPRGYPAASTEDKFKAVRLMRSGMRHGLACRHREPLRGRANTRLEASVTATSAPWRSARPPE